MTDTEALIRDHLPLVDYAVSDMARRVPRHVLRDDLVSAGMYGLTQAAQGYDPTTGVPFTSYARTRIRGALIDELRCADWASRSVRADARKRRAATDKAAARLGRSPDHDEIAAQAGWTRERLQRSIDDTHRATVINYDGLLGEDGSMADVLPDHGPTPEHELLSSERRGYLIDAVGQLPERLRTVVVGYFFQDRPMADIAAELGVTESRVSQMNSEGLQLIRSIMDAALNEIPIAELQVERPGRRAKRIAEYAQAVESASTPFKRLDRTMAAA